MMGMQVADLNRDGRLDVLATGAGASPSLQVMIGDGHGGLLPGISGPIGRQPGRLCVADFNVDAVPDAAAIGDRESLESPIAILIGIGDGSFPPRRTVSPGGGVVQGMQIGDTNGDGHADLVLGTGDGELFTFLGDGNGNFLDRRTGIAFTKGWLRLGDFDEDGTLDLVDADPSGFAIRHGAGDGTFTTSPYFASGPIVGGVDIGDVQPDGHLDVVSTTNSGGMVHLGNGNGTVGSGTSVSSYSLIHQTEQAHFGDVNGDGRDDLVFSHLASLPTVVLTGSGPTYSPAITFASGFIVRGLDTGDFDRDGKLDVVTTYGAANGGALWKGGGNGSFNLLGTYSDGAWPNVRTGRFNVDDSLDFAVLNTYMGTIAIRTGHGDGTFAERKDFGVADFTTAMEPGDLDSDGVQDLAVALIERSVALLLSSGAPHLPIVSHLGALETGSSIRIVWSMAEPTRWTQFAVDRAAGGDPSWQRLDLTLSTVGDTTFAMDDAPPDGPLWYRIAARTSDGQWITSGPVPARDELVPALVSLESARVADGRVHLRWIDATRTVAEAAVERSDGSGGWQLRTLVSADAGGFIEYVDDDVRPGARYGYRLAFEEDGTRVSRGETWLEMPSAARLGISAPNPQPARDGLEVAWRLARPGDAVIRLFDLAGRQVFTRQVRANDAALRRERLTLREPLAPGVYLVTLQSGTERNSARIVVAR